MAYSNARSRVSVFLMGPIMAECAYMDSLRRKADAIARDVCDDGSLQASFGRFDPSDRILARLVSEAAYRGLLSMRKDENG